ncbi:ankyrin repeat domain-containing protein [Spirosoma pollinicola]|uniref:CHAT domain-containing protein n=1 Tax=Spirosoma pollinicola TaxID=2057025 RepID=A0A2K8ZAC0_9BACT|nr:ankyrin repeat domain-containing protein [Spirosoma pollinicola]AUD06769.1 hypothetical protein CWM47_35950 [Spirosoma pollinicola]
MPHRVTIAFFFILCVQLSGRSQDNSWNKLVVSYARKNATSTELNYVFSKGATVNAQDQFGVTALMWYAYHRNFPMVEYLLNRGADPRLKGTIIPDPEGDSTFYYGHALSAAVGSGDYGSIGLLLKAGFPINEAGRAPGGKRGYTALHTACYIGNYDMVVHLLYRVKEQGFATANPNIPSEADGGKTPLKIAIERGFQDIVSVLTKAGAQVGSTNVVPVQQSANKLIVAIKAKESSETIKSLIESGEDVNSRDENGATPLMWAAYLDNQDILKLLIAKGAKARLKGIIYNPLPNARFPYFGNALVAAISNKAHHTAPILLRKCGMRLDEPGITPQGKEISWSALHVASYGVDPWVVDALNRQETLNPDELSATNTASNINHRCLADRKMTPLLYAAQAGEDKLVDQLLEQAADITLVDEKGWTVLHYAVQSGNIKLVQTALNAGLSATQKTTDGQTALSLATLAKRNDMLNLLKAGRTAQTKKVVATLNQHGLDAEVRQISKMINTPAFLADAYEQMGTLYDRTGDRNRANRYYVEASLAREQRLLSKPLPSFRELSFELSEFDEELQKEVRPLLQRVEKATKGGCRGIQSARKDAEDLTAYSLHRLASEYNLAYAACLEQKQDWVELVYVLRMLAFNQKGLKRYPEAESTLKKAGQVVIDHFKAKDQPHVYALTLWELGKFYLNQIEIRNNTISTQEKRQLALKARRVLLKADSCWQKTKDEYSDLRAENLQYLASAYYYTNDTLIRPTTRTILTKFAKSSEAVANTQHWLGLYYLRNGNLLLAEKAFKDGLSRCRTAYNPAHPYFFRLLDDLSQLYSQSNRYTEATFFESQAITTALADAEATNLHVVKDPVREMFSHWYNNFNHIYGRERIREKYSAYSISPHTVELSVYTQLLEWTNQSQLAYETREYAKAGELLRTAYQTILEADEPYDLLRIHILTLLASVSQATGDQKARIKYLQEACEESKTVMGTFHQSYLYALHELAKAYSQTNDQKQARQLFSEGWALLKQRVSLQANLLVEDEFVVTKRELDRFVSYQINFYSESANRDTASSARLYEIVLLQKSLALRSYSGFLQQLSKQQPKEVKTLVDIRKRRNKLLLNPTDNELIWRSRLDTLNGDIIQLERRLASGLLSKSEVNRAYTWKTILQMLDASTKGSKTETAAAVELLRYEDQSNNRIRYGALVITQQDRVPRFVSLSSEQQWQAILSKQSSLHPDSINAFYQNKQLYQLAWQPLEQRLSKSRVIYLSSVAGYSQGLSFSALSRPNNTPIAATQTIRMLLSTSQISNKSAFNLARQPIKALLVGDVDYSCDEAKPKAAPLERTKEEISFISKLIEQHKGTLKVLNERSATEEAFLTETGKPLDLIHLATHGEYLKREEADVDTTNAFLQQTDQGFHSALLMASSDCGWVNPSLLGEQDGILTAREIQSTVTAACQLVVLSACQSALGDTEGSENLLGLCRAFKSVGSNYIIASLWNIDDDSAQKFMEEFYRQLAMSTATIESAFEGAQRTRRLAAGKAVSPWGGFVLVH